MLAIPAIWQTIRPMSGQQINFSPHTEHEDNTFRGLDYEKQEIRNLTFTTCHFRDSVFREVVFLDCAFHDCTFEQCDLSLAKVPGTTFAGTHFRECKLRGVDWTAARWTKFGWKRPFAFHACTLNYSFFSGLKLPNLRLTDCTIKEADFSDTDLTGAIFTGADLQDSRFVNCDLTKADFTGATNYAIDVTRNHLKKTKFALPEAVALLRGLDIVLQE